MTHKKFGALSSSVNPDELSATFEGAVAFIAGVLVFAGALTADQAHMFLANANILDKDVVVLIPLAFSMWGLSRSIFGVLRKAGVFFVTAKPVTVIPQNTEVAA